MSDKKSIIPEGRLEKSILIIRKEKVMLGNDLAVIYGVTAKRLNEQVKRNRHRFPEDFMFQLTKSEKVSGVNYFSCLTTIIFPVTH